MDRPRDPDRANYSPSTMTWLESESFCYPNGGKKRRAKVVFPDGKRRIVRCGLPDTMFSIPVAKGPWDGFIMIEDGEFRFIEHTRGSDEQS